MPNSICPCCRQPFDHRARRLGPLADHVVALVCGVCTGVSVPSTTERIEDAYRARVWGGLPRAAFMEADDGTTRPLDTEAHKARTAAKLQALRAVLRMHAEETVSLLEVGCRDGATLDRVRARLPQASLSAVEPWSPWRREATARGFRVHESTVEALVDHRFDVVVEFDVLDHFSDPVAHLQALRARLQPGGHLLLGVSDVSSCPGTILPHRIRLDTPVGFTRSALRRACACAGLSAAIWEEGATLFAICEPGAPILRDAAPDDATQLARALRENDGRLLLKRVLAEHGPTDAVLRAAEAAFAGCRTRHNRRLLCEDVARACTRARRHDLADDWLARTGATRSQNVA